MSIASKVSSMLGRLVNSGINGASGPIEALDGSSGIIAIASTHVGSVRQNNEDNFLLRGLEDGRVVALVADGVGGQKCGEIASLTIRETIDNYVSEGTFNVSPDAPKVWGGLLTMSAHQAHRAIALRAQENEAEKGMASTLTMVMANNHEGAFVQVGDSRLYKFSASILTQLSIDQTVANALVAAGKLAAADVPFHPGRNVLEYAMGLEAADRPLVPETGRFNWAYGDMLLLCSDGLTDMIPDQKITEILKSKQSCRKKAHKLINAALDAGGRDNITLCLLENAGKIDG